MLCMYMVLEFNRWSFQLGGYLLQSQELFTISQSFKSPYACEGTPKGRFLALACPYGLAQWPDYYKGCKMLPKRHIPWHTCFLERILFKSQILPLKIPQKQQNLLSNFPYGFENVKYTFCLRFKNNPSQPPFNTLFYTFAPLYFAFLLRFCL